MAEVTCLDIIISTLCSPLAWLMNKGCNLGFFINLVLYIVTFSFAGNIHFNVESGLGLLDCVLASFLPPVAVCLNGGGVVNVLICIVLWVLGWFPGVVYAYAVLHKVTGVKKRL